MGAPTFEAHLPAKEVSYSFGFVEYVLWKMSQYGWRYIDLAERSGLTRSRTHYVFHRIPSKRRPGYIHEYNAVAAAFDLSPMEALLADDLCAGIGRIDEAIDTQIKFYSTLIKGFQTEMPSLVARISALEWDDVRQSHGSLIIKRMMADLEKSYCEVAERKELRLFNSDDRSTHI